MAVPRQYGHSVFLNCPFDANYSKLLKAIAFTIIDCGFIPRCALEITYSDEERFKRLLDLIAQCRFGLHDISPQETDPDESLPRFNMPLELGLFLGAKRFGPPKQRSKKCLILEKEERRYRDFISDISGKDVAAHAEDVYTVIKAVRDWLGCFSKEMKPGAKKIFQKYAVFSKQLPDQCKRLDLEPQKLTFSEFKLLAEEWLAKYAEEVSPV